MRIRIRDPETFGPWNRNPGWKIRTRDKNPGSATTGIAILSIPEEYHIFHAIEFCPPESN
jgi:hypothetical protein